MSTIPQVTTLTNSSVEILNVIRHNATQNYQNYIPVATPDAGSIKEIGAIIMDYPQLQNEFLSALVNRIGRVIITSKMYDNPLALFKKGMLEFGETVEDIFVNIAKPFQFDPAVASSEIFKREIPDVRSAFHVMNYQKFYKATVQNDQLRQAFLSWQGITDLIAKIVDSMYTGANYDEFQTTKYMLARQILKGQMYPTTIPAVSKANLSTIVSSVKSFSNKLEFLSPKYNLSGVQTNSLKSEQYIIVDTDFDSEMSVEVLATAFNMDKATFMGQRVLIDGFGNLDTERLSLLFKDDPTYTPLTEAEMTALNSIPAIIVDKDYFMMFDNYVNFTEQYNGEGLYWNYWYHVWKTFSVSPFANNIVFVVGTPAVSSVTVTPSTANLIVGQRLQLGVEVDTDYFAKQSVDWSIVGEGVDATVTTGGVVAIGATATGTVTVRATSTYDDTKYDECTITIV